MKHSSLFKPNFERLTQHLKHVSRERNFQTSPESLFEIQAYIKEELISYGLDVREDPFSFAGQTFSNLLARFPADPPQPRLILGAHFDAVPGTPGADDNATGVAALLECARIYSELRKKEEGSRGVGVEFAAFNIEEYGMIGSRSYAERLKREKVPITGMLSLEMVGYTSHEKGSQQMPFFLKPFYPDVGNFVGIVANVKSKKILNEVLKIFREVEGLSVESLILPGNGGLFPEARLSDHSPFWDEGFPALLVTDTSFFRNPFYHSAEDRLETLDLEFLAKVTDATARVVSRRI